MDIKNADNILDFMNPRHQEQFRKFSQIAQNAEMATNIFETIPGGNNRKIDLFAGIMTVLFIVYLGRNGIHIRFVKKQTETFLLPFSRNYQRLGVPNGRELLLSTPEDIKSIESYNFNKEL